MKKLAIIVVLLAACIAVFGRSARGQESESSAVNGTVVNAEDKRPLREVSVTFTSPDLPANETILTDDQGQFSLTLLPPGMYTLRFEKEGFEPFSQDIQLRPNRTLKVRVQLVRN